MIDRFNAFAYRDENAARSGEGSLAGLTVGVKANIAVKGMPFHAGLAAWEHRVAERDAEVVAKLREAGALICGVLHMEEGALGAKTDNPHFGPVHNPHRHAYSPGGSSGGSGAAVAAGLCDAALGTDTMGSIRIPSAHCGVYGFKPATDCVSQDGLIPADPKLDAIGPLARDINTLERVARVVSDFGEGELAGQGATLADHGVTVDPQVSESFARAVATLEYKPVTETLDYKQSRLRFAGFIETSKFMAEDLAGIPVSDHLAKLLTYGPKRSEADWNEDQAILAQTKTQMRALVEHHGFVILPTVPNPPFPHSEQEPAAQADFTCLANIAGLPAISLPMGWTHDDLPLGVQIMGKPGAEAGLFRIARHIDLNLRAYRAPSEGA